MASTLKVNTIAHTGGTNAMTIDSGGRMVQSNRPLFFVNANNTANSGAKWSTGGTSGNNFTPIPFDTEIIDRTNSFDPSTFKFTVPVAGDYLFYVWGISGDTNEWLRIHMVLLRGGNYYSIGATQQDYSGSASNDFGNASMQIMNPMQASDVVWCTLDTTQGGTESMYMGASPMTGMTTPPSGMSTGWNGFGGYLI
tara:strand:+ start:568 stop:1155 length:588 start_codon:yes stop_codon:yes gene_type:complete